MGYAISWLAIRGSSEPAVLAALGLEKTGEKEKENVPESDWCSTQVGEWIVIWSNSFEPARFVDAASRMKGEAVICDVEEHVMFVSVTAFEGGVPSWRIVHDAQQGRDHLTVEGKPPESLARIQAEEFARVSKDGEVDFVFEIPIRMAIEVVGFRHDADSATAFETLRLVSEPKAWWRIG
jgi:hypothetical protein